MSILTQSCSGLEPLFQPFYIRRKKVNPGEEGVRVDFTDELGVTWQEFPVLHPKFKEWAEEYTETIGIENYSKEYLEELFEKSPWYGSTANDIDWVKRVEIQGIIQKYITHSISSTINLPKEVTTDEVAEIYLESWKKGLKGITVYRDGSRSGVLVTESNKNRNEFEYIDSVKRPKELEAELHLTKAGGEAYNVFVGLMSGKPYEIFIVQGSENPSKGTIKKVKKGYYVYCEGEKCIEISSNISEAQAAITRLTSISLRHGADIKFIVEQIHKCGGDLFSFTKGLARVLKKYIPEGAKSTVTCQDCGSSDVIFQEGCNSCQSCGSSKCG